MVDERRMAFDGDRLFLARRKAKMNRKTCSQILGIHPHTLENIEKGKTVLPNAYTTEKLIELFGKGILKND